MKRIQSEICGHDSDPTGASQPKKSPERRQKKFVCRFFDLGCGKEENFLLPNGEISETEEIYNGDP